MNTAVKADPDLTEALVRLATHPVTFGFGAGLARWVMGDRDGGWKQLLWQIIVSVFVAFAASLYLKDEALTDSKLGFYVCLAAFVAKDLLLAVIALAGQFARDPIGAWQRIRDAFKGAPK